MGHIQISSGQTKTNTFFVLILNIDLLTSANRTQLNARIQLLLFIRCFANNNPNVVYYSFCTCASLSTDYLSFDFGLE